MRITLRGQIHVHILAVYAPTAITPYEDKEKFHVQLRALTKKYRKKGMLIIGADMNIKFLEPGATEEEGVGPHVFDAGEAQEGEGVERSRYLLRETLIDTQTMLANTFVSVLCYKMPDQLARIK